MSEETALGPEIFVELDKPRPIKYTFKSFCRLEREQGMKIGDILNMLNSWMQKPDSIEMTKLAVLMWAGLIHGDPDLTPLTVEDIIPSFKAVQEIMPKLSAAIIQSMGADEEKKTKARTAKPTIPNSRSHGANS